MSNNLKIKFIIGTMARGGAERVVSLLSNNLVKKDYDIEITTIYGDIIKYELSSDIKTYAIECKCKNKVLRVFERIFLLREHLKSNEKTIFVSFLADVNIYFIIASLFLKNTKIVSERNDPNRDPNNRLLRHLRNILYFIPDGIVFQTQDAMNYFEKNLHKKSIVIKNPIIQGLPLWEKNNFEKVIVAVGRLYPQKNFKMLLHSFAEFQRVNPDYRLLIFGEGPLRCELEKQILELGLQKCVDLPGELPNIHKQMSKAAMFVLSSDYEGISNALIEAMGIGMPVISTDCPIGGSRELIINKNNGLLVKVGDYAELAESMKCFVENIELRELCATNAANVRLLLNENAIVEEWEKFIVKIASSK